MNKSVKWVWLSLKCKPGSTEILKIIEKLGTIDAIFDADYDTYTEIGVSERLSEDLCDKSLDQAKRIVGYCQGSGIGLLCYDDHAYPATLRSLKNPPAVLYYDGRLPNLNKKLCISIVGTRKMSEYGMKSAYKIAYEVASSGAIVVSGMALGIDGIASCASIAAGGTTVAVLGCGIDVVYPKEHSNLKEIIKQNGVVITEYPPSTEPRGSNFPVRNRIISGLSQGTVVVDADLSSGAMITAKNAILQGRDVYAVPGNIDAESNSGTNSLIRDGAQAVLKGNDIIRNYSFLYRDSLDVQRMLASETRSEFNSDAVRRMGVNMRPSASELNGGTKQKGNGEADRKASYTVKVETDDVASKRESRNKASFSANNRAFLSNSEQNASENTADKKQTVSDGKRGGDSSAEVLEKLTEKQRKIFEEMPLDRAVTVDYLAKTGFGLGEVISALTVLEIKGLVCSLPGALYMRK